MAAPTGDAHVRLRNGNGNANANANANANDHPTTTPNPSTETTPIAPAARDYASISPAPSRAGLDLDHGAPSTSTSTWATAPALQEGGAGVSSGGKRGRWAAAWEKWGSVELENKGSVARDHLALERTFLAWLRTSLSFASIGIAITQLFRLNSSLHSSTNTPYSSTPSSSSSTNTNTHNPHRLRHLGKPLGATFLGISILILLLGFHRYFEAQHYVIRGKFPASRGSVMVVSAVAGALIGGSLVVILVVGEGMWES